MKERMGYVSNSSSSSFVMMGVEVEIDEEMRDEVKRHGLWIHEGHGEIEAFVGKQILAWDDYSHNIASYSGVVTELHAAFEALGIPHDEIKIFGTTEYD